MKKLLGLCVGVVLFALLLFFNLKVVRAAARVSDEKAAQERQAPASSSDDNATALTIYNQNFFVAREHVPLDLKAGVNQAEFAGIAAHLEPDSVILRDPNGRALQILEQNYRNDPISQELLLSFYEGKTIDFLIQRADKQEIVKGKIVRSGYIPSTNYAQGYSQPGMGQPIIEIDGVLRFGLPGQPLFPALTGDSILKPALSWMLETNDPGKFDAEISYVSGGMNWQADYNLVVSDKSNSKFDLLDMIGWVTMHNQSGKTFENAISSCWPATLTRSKVARPPVECTWRRPRRRSRTRCGQWCAKSHLTSFICIPWSDPLRCMTKRLSRWSLCVPQVSTRCDSMSTTVRKSISMATTTWSKSGRTRTTARSPIPRYG